MSALAGYPFTEDEMRVAHETWHCNCGPSALAFALQTTFEKIRPAMSLVGFESKKYTTPTMIKDALVTMGVKVRSVKVPIRNSGGGLDIDPLFHSLMSLVRVQWTGPWTKPGANPRWAYRQTHWITTWTERGVAMVFDCNGGIRGFDSWEHEIVPLLTAMDPRADGGWHPTHIWRVTK